MEAQQHQKKGSPEKHCPLSALSVWKHRAAIVSEVSEHHCREGTNTHTSAGPEEGSVDSAGSSVWTQLQPQYLKKTKNKPKTHQNLT